MVLVEQDYDSYMFPAVSDSEADDSMGVPLNGSMNGLNSSLQYHNSSLSSTVLDYMNTLRKAGQLCDCFIRVSKSTEYAAHRAVLAAVSPYFMTLFEHDPRMDKLKTYDMPDVSQEAFQILLNYAYTGCLYVESKDMKCVYEVAVMLKFPNVASVCADHMIESLTIHNCFDVREFFHQNSEHAVKVDKFIQESLKEIKLTKAYFQLPNINIKVLGRVREESPGAEMLAKLVTDWLMARVADESLAAMDSVLLQHESVLFLSNDNHLVDSGAVADVAKNDAVKDYIKTCKKYAKISPNNFITSEPMNVEHSTAGSLIACESVDEMTYCVILILHGHVHNVGVRFHTIKSKAPSTSSSGSSSEEDNDGCVINEGLTSSTMSSFEPLAEMSVARCGVGLATLDGKIIAVGGNDRGECLDSAEVYDSTANRWTCLPSMSCSRGRFECAVVQDKMYACGGSDGKRELSSVECFDGKKWTPLPHMMKTKSSAGVGVLNEKLFVVGGYNGSRAEASCEMYEPQTKQWTSIADLNIGRSQSAVCSANGRLYAFGGTNSWNCFDSVEVYDPVTNKWLFVSPMSQARRGAAVAVFRGKVYLVGGSNGSTSVSTVEIYDPMTDSWKAGPMLRVPRANAGLVVCDGRLYITGGYSGNEFLSTLELLEGNEDSQWCSYLKTSSTLTDSDPDH